MARMEAMTPRERVALADEIIERGKRYLPALEEARAKGLVPPRPEDEGDGQRRGRSG